MPRWAPLEDRLWSQVSKDGPLIPGHTEMGPCWSWTGRTQQGYGVIRYASMNGQKVHRVVYQLLVGPIPDGLTLDHLCHSLHPSCSVGDACPHRACVNPAHLEPVTFEENAHRGMRARMTHCMRGHSLLDPANLKPTKNTSRQCRTCSNEANVRYLQRQRDALARA